MEELWKIQQQSQALQEFRHEIQPLWADEAEREFNVRFFLPHENDDKQMLEQLNKYFELGHEIGQMLDSANQHRLRIEKLSFELTECLDSIEQDVNTGYQLQEQYREYVSLVEALIPQVADLIMQANASCQGAPTK